MGLPSAWARSSAAAKRILMADCLNEPVNDFRIRVGNQVFEELGNGHGRFIAGRDNVTEPEAPRIGKQADAQPAAMRNDADIASEAGRVAQFLKIGRAPVMRVQDAHAVGAAESDVVISTNLGNPRLPLAPGLAVFGKPTVVNDSGLHAALCPGHKGVDNALMTEAKHRDIRGLGKISDARITGSVQHRRVIRIDRVDAAGKTQTIERVDNPLAGRRFVRRANDSDRFRFEQRVYLHGQLLGTPQIILIRI